MLRKGNTKINPRPLTIPWLWDKLPDPFSRGLKGTMRSACGLGRTRLGMGAGKDGWDEEE